VSQQIHVKRQRLNSHGRVIAAGASAVKVEGAASVIEVLSPELAECEGVRMINNNL